MELTPTVLWAQSDDKLFLTVELSKVEDVKCVVTESDMNFSCKKGSDFYLFEFKFYKPVKSDSVQRVADRFLKYTIQKLESGTWTSLNSCGKKHYIKCDWDKWVDSDAEDEDGYGGMPNFDDFGDFGGMGDMGDMDDLNDLEDTEDEDDVGKSFKPESVAKSADCGCCSGCTCGSNCKCGPDSKCCEGCVCGTNKEFSDMACSPTCSCVPGRCGPKCCCTPAARCSEECTC